MLLNRPILDDRSFEQIRNDLISRIPVYAPEWTDHNASDPGITLIELFSFLGENLLYRFNQIPEATQLEFLKLLQIPLTPAQPAKAMLAFTTEESNGVKISRNSVAKAGDVGFTTLSEVRVLPLSAFAVGKIAEELPDDGSEEEQFFEQAFRTLALTSSNQTAPYQSKILWEQEPNTNVDFNDAVDGMMWVAVLAEDADSVPLVKQNLTEHEDAPLLLNLGFVPDIRIDRDQDTHSQEFANRFRCPGENADDGSGPAVQWQIWSELAEDFVPTFRAITVEGDTTQGLTREGVVRLRLPKDLDEIGVFAIDDLDAVGTGELPPPLDDELNERVVCWLRAWRPNKSRFGKLIYVAANATQVVQTMSSRAEFLGTGTGQPNQVYNLANSQVLPDSVELEVEESGGVWRPWKLVDGFFSSNENDRHFSLDAAAGTVKFGIGMHGYVPQIGQRIRVKRYSYGGGVQGNVAPKTISKLSPNKAVKLLNPLAAYDGADAESLEQALQRIPSELRRRDRAVTQSDFKELALMTPGANIARAECLPRYHPVLPNQESAGVVSAIIWPQSDADNPNAPMPNKNQVRSVCKYLDARRLVTTELYVLPPKYRSISVAVGIKVKPGFGIDAVRHWVELVIRQFLAPLPPYGPSGSGWPLGRRVHGPEIEAAAHQVEGVEYLEDLQLVGWDEAGRVIHTTVYLEKNEVPELVGITVEAGPITIDPSDLDTISPHSPANPPVPIPVLREEC